MKIKSTLFIILCFFTFFNSFGQDTYTILFKTDEYKLSKADTKQVVDFYKQKFKGSEIITIKGHTDNEGSDEYNRILSKNRVETVSSILQTQGHPKANLVLDYFGEKAPLNKNSTREEQAKNRRVELSWEKVEEEIVEEGDIQELYKLIEPERQRFCINPNKDTMLRLEKGTIIFIPANAFKTNGENCVQFSAKEAFSLGDMLLENLSTTSNDALLETGGMVYTEAKNDSGAEVVLNPGKSLTIMIPTDTLRPDMLLFEGNRDNNQDMNWDLPGGRRIPLGNFNHGDCWQRDTLIPECYRCPIIFCRFGRIDETIKGMVDSVQRSENKKFRECQRSLGPRSRGSMSGLASDYYWPDCEGMMDRYGVKDYDALMDTLAKIRNAEMQLEFDKYGVDNYADYIEAIRKYNQELKEKHMLELGVTTEQEYRDTLRKIQIQQWGQEIEKKVDELGNGTSLDDLKYYVAEVNQMGWINCDAFSNLRGRELRTVNTSLPAKPYIDCKIIFRDRKSIMTPKELEGKFVFPSVPKDIPITFFALKYVANQAYVYFEDGTSSDDFNIIKYRAVSKEELIKILMNLEFESGN